MKKNAYKKVIKLDRLLTKTAISLMFIAILMFGISCDDTNFFTFAKENGNYGPAWSFDDPSFTVTITFPGDVANGDNANNYRIINYTGDGTVGITASYGGSNRIVNLGLSFNGTTTVSDFSVEVITSYDDVNSIDTSITTMDGHVLQGYVSPLYFPACFYGCLMP